MEEITLFMFYYLLILFYVYTYYIQYKYLIDPKIARLVGRVAKRIFFKVYFDQCVNSVKLEKWLCIRRDLNPGPLALATELQTPLISKAV